MFVFINASENYSEWFLRFLKTVLYNKQYYLQFN